MQWLESFMWAWCRFVCNVFTVAGLIGLAGFAAAAMDSLFDKIMYREAFHEDQDRS